ncbi:MAG: hypothetical protein QOH98_1259 [Methylobacteriaceae bacterium]|jgi:hypothetical protein|nr:hypothetical protein [Methylobacteriaceae bacterium]
MNLPAIVTVSATMPLFAAVISEETRSDWEDVLAVGYVSAVGMLISLAALLDDVFDLTSWFGLATTPGLLP